MQIQTVEISGTVQRYLVTRDEAARMLNVNADSIGRWVRSGEGIGACVVARGGSGEPMLFDLAMLIEWYLAREGKLEDHMLRIYRGRAVLPLEERGFVRVDFAELRKRRVKARRRAR